MTRNQQPWLHDFDISVDGPVTIVAERSGDLGGHLAATGVIVDDRRTVSTIRLLLDGVECVPIASSVIGASAEHWCAARHLGDPGPDPTVEVHRRRVIDGLGVTETITVRSRHSEGLSTTLSVLTGGDGADIGSIKSGQTTTAMLAPTLEPCGWSDDRHRTRLAARPTASEVSIDPDGPLCLHWPLDLDAYGSVSIVLTWSFERCQTTDFDADAGAPLADWDPDELAATIADARLADLVRVGLTDLRHLTLRDPLEPADIVAAAGTPWYLTLFGRDAIWTARFMIAHSPALAAGTLRSLARRQATDTDAELAAEPGKILHELRRTTSAATDLGLPPRYYGTVDATPLWIVLLRDAWRRGMADHHVTELLPALDAALTWMDNATQATPDALVWYADRSTHGLANQGWKDSADAMRRADGTIAPSPIALLEVQAYAVEAAHAAAELGAAFGRDLQHWQQWATNLADRVRQRFWIGHGDDAYLAMALDANGEPVDGVASNMGHALGTGLLTPNESERVVERLLRPDMLKTFGIATLSSDNPAYNPVGYHTGSVWAHDTAIIANGMARAGFHDQAAIVAERLLRLATATNYRLPELCGAEPVGRSPVPYPASCRPQAWAAAAAAVISDVLRQTPP